MGKVEEKDQEEGQSRRNRWAEYIPLVFRMVEPGAGGLDEVDPLRGRCRRTLIPIPPGYIVLFSLLDPDLLYHLDQDPEI